MTELREGRFSLDVSKLPASDYLHFDDTFRKRYGQWGRVDWLLRTEGRWCLVECKDPEAAPTRRDQQQAFKALSNDQGRLDLGRKARESLVIAWKEKQLANPTDSPLFVLLVHSACLQSYEVSTLMDLVKESIPTDLPVTGLWICGVVVVTPDRWETYFPNIPLVVS